MEISNPKRILVLSTPEDGSLDIIQKLTSSAPTPIDSSIAGLTHTWTLKTPYYTANLSIWIDDISDTSAWLSEYSQPEAREVLSAVGATILIFRKPVTNEDLEAIKDRISAIKSVLSKAIGEYAECTLLAVGTKQSVTTDLRLDSDNEEWEDFCQSKGFEYIDATATGLNSFGEKVGVERLREALETTDWEPSEELDFEDDFEGEDDFGDEFEELGLDGLAGEQAEMNVELLGMKGALRGEGEEEQVEEMGRMMGRLMGIKDMADGMPEEERKKFAAKAVKDFMKDV